MNLFVYGTLLFPSIRRLVIGRDIKGISATLTGYQIYRVKDATFPAIVQATAGEETASIPGEIITGLSEVEMDRLDQYEDTFYQRIEVSIDEQIAQVYILPAELAAEVLSEDNWTREWFATHHYAAFLERISRYY